jgi:pyrroline-5-carboxylate reductase
MSSSSSPSEAPASSLAGKTIGFIGAGNMAQAIVRGLLARGSCRAEQVSVASPSGAAALRGAGVACSDDNAAVARASDVIVLAVKPFKVWDALQPLRGASLRPGCIVISVASGVSTDVLLDMFSALGHAGAAAPFVLRVMPNTPAQVLAGAAGCCAGRGCGPAQRAVARELFEAVGRVQDVEEKHMDAVCGLSGSGPAFVMLFIEALADGAVASGLPRPMAMALALQLVRGAAAMAQETGVHPGALKDAVASPGGTTIAGIHELEKGAFRGAVMSAVVAASAKSEQIGASERAKWQALGLGSLR